jgi:hypothetical protein
MLHILFCVFPLRECIKCVVGSSSYPGSHLKENCVSVFRKWENFAGMELQASSFKSFADLCKLGANRD